MAKPKMYGSIRQYIPNNTADQRRKRFKRKASKRRSDDQQKKVNLFVIEGLSAPI